MLTTWWFAGQEGPGDILVFLTGRDEIERAVAAIAAASDSLHPRAPQLLALPLYAGLSSDAQMAVFDAAPDNHRKVVVSTNIAEASLTIPGVAFVVDCGLVKLRAFNPATGIESLATAPLSAASATQRAGRAGRTRPGKCFRLFPASHELAVASVPEIQRSNLAPTVLQLKALGIDNVVRFALPTPPPAELMARALELLYALGALDDYARLTRPLGERMAELPLDPMLARALLASVEAGCWQQMLSIAAMTAVQGVFVARGDADADAAAKKRLFAVEEGDHLTLLNVYAAFTAGGQQQQQQQHKSAQWCRSHGLNFQALSRAVSVRSQLRRYLARFYPDLDAHACQLATEATLRRTLVAGYFAHAARMHPDGSYRLARRAHSAGADSEAAGSGGSVVWAHPSSVLFNRKADWVVFHEAVDTGRSGKTFIRDLTVVEREWLVDCAPGYYRVR